MFNCLFSSKEFFSNNPLCWTVWELLPEKQTLYNATINDHLWYFIRFYDGPGDDFALDTVKKEIGCLAGFFHPSSHIWQGDQLTKK
jgi:hypothetical protein